MYLKSLAVQGLRNLQPTQLSFSPSLNLLYGENGSGKTSLLEAIWLLGRGRSFRTRHLSSLIQFAQSQCTVSGMVANDDMGEDGFGQTQLGVSREKGGDFQFRVNRSPVKSSSLLAEQLPLLLINAESFQLIEGGPGFRRRYLDWLVFHVEHRSRPVWKQFNQVAKQRNSLLRRGKISAREMSYWNQQYIALSEQVNAFRQELLTPLFESVYLSLDEMAGVDGLTFEFDCGWDQAMPLADQLSAVFDKELVKGISLLGPQRADIRIRRKGRLAREALSRGQVKIVACAMQVAQVRLHRDRTGSCPVVLVDDLPAELDRKHRDLVLSTILAGGAQVLATGVEGTELYRGQCRKAQVIPDMSMFHVEQGVINAVRHAE